MCSRGQIFERKRRKKVGLVVVVVGEMSHEYMLNPINNFHKSFIFTNMIDNDVIAFKCDVKFLYSS